MILRYLDRSHRSGEVTPRTHPVPQLVEVVRLVVCEPVDAHGVHARRTVVRLDPLPRLVNEALSNLKRLHLPLWSLHQLLPRRVGRSGDLACPAPSLQPHYRAFIATTSRSAPVPRIGTLPPTVFAAWGPPSRRPGGRPHPFQLAVRIETTGSPVPCQRLRRAHATYTPDTARAAQQAAPWLRARHVAPPFPGAIDVPVSMPSS